MFKPVFALLLSIFLFAACDSSDTTRATIRYQVELLDATATTVATGQISFQEALVGSQSTGAFTLEATGGGPVSPLASTTGTVNTLLDIDGTIQINASEPNMSDSGLRFDADYSASGFTGTWGTITIVGYSEQGTFTATAIAQ